MAPRAVLAAPGLAPQAVLALWAAARRFGLRRTGGRRRQPTNNPENAHVTRIEALAALEKGGSEPRTRKTAAKAIAENTIGVGVKGHIADDIGLHRLRQDRKSGGTAGKLALAFLQFATHGFADDFILQMTS